MGENKGMDFSESFTLLLVALKLCRIIDMSWGWVFAPVAVSVLFVIIVYTLANVYASFKNRRR